MSQMIEAASPTRSIYAEEKPGLLRYTASCAMTIAVFCGLLWLAS